MKITDRQTIHLVLEVPPDLLRPTFGRFIKCLGRYYGCKVLNYHPVAGEPWEALSRAPAARTIQNPTMG